MDPVPGRAVIDVRATFAGRRWPWGFVERPTAPVRSTEGPAGGVIPATRREPAGGHPADDGPDERAARGRGVPCNQNSEPPAPHRFLTAKIFFASADWFVLPGR
jgi:hypothetical protein